MLLDAISGPADLRRLNQAQLVDLAKEIRELIVDRVTANGGHLGSNLGVVELTLALHRVFESPDDIILWDTGHQAYVHKMVTGRWRDFDTLRQPDGLSGYPNRTESPHDWVENSHASTALSYAHGLASAQDPALGGAGRRVVAVIGDGSLTGGMAFEGLNNLGHSGRPVIIVLNDNGRSYAPTISLLSASLIRLRLDPRVVREQDRLGRIVHRMPLADQIKRGWRATKAAVREMWEPRAFFEDLGVRYTGPVDGHDIAELERALRMTAAYGDGPVVLHVLTEKGRGYAPAENDPIKKLHDMSDFKVGSYTAAFSEALIKEAEHRPDVVAITAAMPDSTGLLPFAERFPERFFDVGIAEQHALTSAAGMAMGRLRPVVAIYSTFLSRGFDQLNLDVGLHGQPVVLCIDRAGITGDDGPSHHGLLDLVLLTKVPGMTVFCPSSYQELQVMLHDALDCTTGPCAIRWPKTTARNVAEWDVGSGLHAKRVRWPGGGGGADTGAPGAERPGPRDDHAAPGAGPDRASGRDRPASEAEAPPAPAEVCLIGVGKMLATCLDAADLLAADGIEATVWDPRVVKPLDGDLVADAARHRLVVTIEDGLRDGGAGSAMADAILSCAADGDGPLPIVRVLGVPTRYLPHGKPDQLLRSLGLDAGSVAAEVHRLRARLVGR